MNILYSWFQVCLPPKSSRYSVEVVLILVVAPLYFRYAPDENTGTIAAPDTTPQVATIGYSHLCQPISQALKQATGTIDQAL